MQDSFVLLEAFFISYGIGINMIGLNKNKVKHLKLIAVLVVLISQVSCEPPVIFNEPQPTNTGDLSKFPNRIQGLYVSIDDSSTLLIDNSRMIRSYDYDYSLHPNQLDSTSQLEGDTLIDHKTNERMLINYSGDSLIIHVHCMDTLFQLDDDHIAKKFKGFYFLNTRYDKAGWEVKKVQLTKGQLMISSISTKSDLEILTAITETPQDTIPPYTFTPSKKQFKEFVTTGGFRDNETFIRLKKHK